MRAARIDHGMDHRRLDVSDRGFRAVGGCVRRRILVLTSVMSAIVCARVVAPLAVRELHGGGVSSPRFVILIVELGQAIRQALRTGRIRVRSESSLVRRMAGQLPLAWHWPVSCWEDLPPVSRRCRLDHGSAILALFPYEGQFDPTRPARDVILRLADFARL